MSWEDRIIYMKEKKAKMKADEEAENKRLEEIEEAKYKEKLETLVFIEDEMNEILGYVEEADDKLTVTQEIIDEDYYDRAFEGLLGYNFKIECTSGDHRNDGQMVDYKITITNPNGKKLVLDTEMCLMVHWNLKWGKYDLKNMTYED